jgi:hypothetical protein
MRTPGAELERIRTLATRFRRAIEACGPASLHIGMDRFPRGSCGDATPLLGTFLIEQGCSQFDYMLGHLPCKDPEEIPHSHAWLQRGDLVVDITADQFPGIDSPVIVTEPSPWHATLEGVRQNKADYRIYDPETTKRLGEAYRKILRRLSSA